MLATVTNEHAALSAEVQPHFFEMLEANPELQTPPVGWAGSLADWLTFLKDLYAQWGPIIMAILAALGKTTTRAVLLLALLIPSVADAQICSGNGLFGIRGRIHARQAHRAAYASAGACYGDSYVPTQTIYHTTVQASCYSESYVPQGTTYLGPIVSTPLPAPQTPSKVLPAPQAKCSGGCQCPAGDCTCATCPLGTKKKAVPAPPPAAFIPRGTVPLTRTAYLAPAPVFRIGTR